ncbi:MAG: glycosyltransferase family 4 protein [Acidimicrobiales bacterium]
MRHLLVTNDFPPKVGGIQSYLWELWRRLRPDDTVVLTPSRRGADGFDRRQPFRIVRTRDPVLLPQPWIARRIDTLADEVGADLVLLDPAMPIGLVGPSLRHAYGVVLHGAEVTVPGRLPGTRAALAHVLRDARVVISAGEYAAAEAERAADRALPVLNVPPGVDVDRFHPLTPDQQAAARARFGLPSGPLVVGVSRLVPRKGFDVLISVLAQLAPRHTGLTGAIAGSGRDEARLRATIARSGAPVRLLGRVANDQLPALYACADLFAMPCRSRWFGLEQEGFGIVFLEAAACGIAQIAGASGGAEEAVVHGSTGLVVDRPDDVAAVAAAIDRLLNDGGERIRLGAEARRRAVAEFSYDALAARLQSGLDALA